MKTGFLGAGRMAEGILSAALKSGIAPEDIVMAEKNAERAAFMREKHGVATTAVPLPDAP